MSVEVKSVYQGQLTIQSSHGPSGAQIATTAPADNGGTGDLFAPTDLLATALGNCMMTIMGLVADREKIDLTGSTIRVEKNMRANPRRVQKVITEFDMPQGLTEDQKKKLAKAADTCPVKQSLHPDVEIEVKFNW